MSNLEKKIKGSATGHNGIINYEIDVDNNKIEDLKITKHSETSGIFDQVIDKLKERIISQQSFDVDAISGATVMTQAILDSAKKVVTDSDVHLTPSPQGDNYLKNTRLKADVVIIGGGEAGLVAGARAISMGEKVILVEKNGYLGGATILNGSNVVGTGSKVSQQALGDTKDTPKTLMADVARESKNTNTQVLTELMSNNIGPAIDFVSDYAGLQYQKAQTQTPEHSVERQIELPSASSYEFIQKVSKAFEKNGGQILLGTKVKKITFSGKGEINGLVAEGENEMVRIKARSIVLATGGFGANEKMRGDESKGIDYYGPMTSTGDAYTFNKNLDLQTQHLDWYKVYPHGVEVEPGIAKLTTYASKKATDMGALYVNSKGARIVNESAVYTDFRDAILDQPDKIAYMVMDERTWQEVYKLLVLHDFTEKEIQKFFDEKHRSPLFVKGSLKEVAEAAGINEPGLAKTIANYQKYAETGNDPDFHREAKFMHKFDGDTFYVIEQRGRFATTLGGYVVNPDTLQLVNKANESLDNYYAAGEVIGGANGHDSMPSMMNSWGISSGYLAGEQASLNADKKRAEGGDEYHLAAILGTNADKSYNRKLLYAMQEMFDTKADINICEIKDLPMFNEDLKGHEPESVKQLADTIADADGVIFAVPEYDHAIPAVLKSAIEWLSCGFHPFVDKPVMIVGTSLGIQGTVRAQMNLRQILDAPGVEAQVMSGNEFMLPNAGRQFENGHELQDAGSVKFLEQCFSHFLNFVDKKRHETEENKIESDRDIEFA